MDRQGQGAIEYLLIIGAAILVVAVVIIALTSVTSSATDNTGADDVNGTLVPLCKELCTSNNGTWAANKCTNPDTPLTGQCAQYN
ncbi:MAG: hypothetical protein WC915_03015 [archaeon]|jgi:hypothetical protein